MMHNVTSIGLISDTHGLLREEAARALEGSELIIHAGDVGNPEIIETLKRIAPVVAVRGNVDIETWASALPETEVVETSAATIFVLHDAHALDLNPAAAGFHIVVSGHSHKPGCGLYFFTLSFEGEPGLVAQAEACATKTNLPQGGKHSSPAADCASF